MEENPTERRNFHRIDGLFPNLLSMRCTGGPPLDDEEWHVTDYYENIRTKVLNLNQTLGKCLEFEGVLPTRICSTPMKVSKMPENHIRCLSSLDRRELTKMSKSNETGSDPVHPSSQPRENLHYQYSQTNRRRLRACERKDRGI